MGIGGLFLVFLRMLSLIYSFVYEKEPVILTLSATVALFVGRHGGNEKRPLVSILTRGY